MKKICAVLNHWAVFRVHLKMTVMSSCTQPHVIPNPNRYIKEIFCSTFKPIFSIHFNFFVNFVKMYHVSSPFASCAVLKVFRRRSEQNLNDDIFFIIV